MTAQQQAHGRPTPLHALHTERRARFAPFAGYALPVSFPPGILAEHRHTRTAAGLFDVSHMGQADLEADPACLETLFPADIAGLNAGRLLYTILLNPQGGIIDDLIIARLSGSLFRIVINAAGAENVCAHIAQSLAGRATLRPRPDLALLALQGPLSAPALGSLSPKAVRLPFMAAAALDLAGHACLVSRSGYTGEDGYEISIPAEGAETLARQLLAQDGVKPAGLGARDSLRLEAGLCLYGSDIDETTSPLEAGLLWTIPPRRRAEANFPGAAALAAQIENGARRRRIGLKIKSPRPVRAHAEILDANRRPAGLVTSGGIAATCDSPIAMGYVRTGCDSPGSPLFVRARDSLLPAEAHRLPFRPHRYHRPKPNPSTTRERHERNLLHRSA